MGFIFGGNTGQSYEDIQAKRKIAEQLLQQNASTPRNVGEGLSAIGRALAYRNITKKADTADATNKAAFDQQYSGLFAGSSGGSAPSFAPVDPNSPEGIGDATMVALGKAPDFAKLESTYGLPSGYLSRTAQLESGGNPNAQNPNSSAGGMFQFIDSTAKQYGLTDKTDPIASADAAARLAADNKAYLTKALGREPSAGELYLAHQQGPAGAAKLILNQGAPAASLVGNDAVALNGGSGGMTGGDFAQKWLAKFGGEQPQSGSGMSIQALAEVAGSPYATPGQKAVAAALLQQQMDAADPAKKLALEKAQLEIDKLKNPKAAGSPEYGLNPIVTQDEQGKYHLFQIPKDGGKPKEVELPYGWTPQQQYLDTGTGFVAAPKQGTAANLEPVVTKDVAGKAAETAVGEAAGAAQVALPGAAQAAADVAAQVESLKNDEYLPNMLGPVDSLLPNVSEDAARVQGKMNQIQGGAFLQARQLLKGGGAITDYEGQKAEAAFARLAAAQNPEDYKAALDEFNYFVQQGLKKLEAQAAMTSKPQDAPSGSTYTFNPETGELE